MKTGTEKTVSYQIPPHIVSPDLELKRTYGATTSKIN